MKLMGLRDFAVAACAVGSLLVWTDASVGAVPKKPNDARCEKWVLMSPAKGNWVGSPKEKWWLCVEGRIKGATASASRASGSSTASVVNTDTDTDTDTSISYPGNSTNNRNDIGRAQRKGNNGIGTGDGLDGGNPPGGGNTRNDRN